MPDHPLDALSGKSGSSEKGKLQSIMFDMDGVILDSMPVHAASWIRAFREHGLILDDMDIYRREGMSGPDSVRDIFLEKGLSAPDDSQLAGLVELKRGYFSFDSIPLFEGVREMLEFLKRDGMKLALVTGSPRSLMERIVPESALSCFSVSVTADDVKRGKPDPEPYLKALHHLNSRPENSVVIENAPMGIRSAKSAGLVCYAIETSLPGEYLNEADLVFHDHQSLFSFLRKRITGPL
jgi:beta-phosphoglucomutase